MSAPKTRAIAIASLLTTALNTSTEEGVSARVHIEETDTGIRVWAPLPAALAEATRLRVLDFLTANADRFGHECRSSGPAVLWAEVHHVHTPHPAASEPEEAP
ncbi:hypothetical protein [Streptomyces sp. NPDC001652]|uniref:hypothetical protein n=1 Tax=Streptomyces sp. NPDC001652 TaxID=3154393 RepID=UPI003327062F